MTVAELIAALQDMPQDADVAVWEVIEIGDGTGEWSTSPSVRLVEGTETGIDSIGVPRRRCVVIG